MLQKKLFYRLAFVFFIVLLLTSIIVTVVAFETAQNYHDEANQKLNAKLARFTNDHVNTFLPNGLIDSTAINDVMHSMMVINPDVEVYLLDTAGNITFHVAPDKKVVRTSVNLTPIKSFINNERNASIKGDDPRHENQQKVFSAAAVMKDEVLKGYYYIILASQERAGVLNELKKSFAINTGSKLILFTMLGSFLLGLFGFWYQVNKLKPITAAMLAFRKGDYTARVTEKQSAFSELAKTFNSMASQIEESVAKIKSIDHFRKELIANISHDLRTPLSIIIGYTETLQMKDKDLSLDEKNRFTTNILESSKRLNGLVNQLFELSNLENNQVTLQKEPFSLEELVSDLSSRYEILAKKKAIQIRFEPKDNLPLAFGDLSLVERVIQNLMDNALKFTNEGGFITLSIASEGDKVLFKISDTGIGIPPNQLSAVFDRYMTDSDKDKKGTGLGLAIANKIMELHSSKIYVLSKLNEGTTFSFSLPVHI